MPCCYTIDVSRNLVITEMSAIVTFEDALEHQRMLIADPQFHPTMSQLVDATNTREVRWSFEDTRTIASRSHFSRHSRRAIVVPSAALFGLAREFATLRETEGGTEQILVTRDMKQALAWLAANAETSITTLGVDPQP
jgi:hypothetical protein